MNFGYKSQTPNKIPLIILSQKHAHHEHFSSLPFFSVLQNSMICSNIWHKYHEWYFEIVNLRQLWNITFSQISCVQIMLLFVYSTTRKGFVAFIMICRYFKLRWNTTAQSQSNYRSFSCSSIWWWIDDQIIDLLFFSVVDRKTSPSCSNVE